MLLLPADHYIADPSKFRKAVEEAAPLARKDRIVAFGVTPTRPETGYGYIRVGDAIDNVSRKVEAFVEKPSLETAASDLKSGNYLWNSGITLCKPGLLIEEMLEFRPDIVLNARRAIEFAERDSATIRLASEFFEKCDSVSIDYSYGKNFAGCSRALKYRLERRRFLGGNLGFVL